MRARTANCSHRSCAVRTALVNYPTEWCHWSYGDRYWALMTGATAAVYGPVGCDPVAR